MRTTLTLEDDVATKLEEYAHQHRLTFKDAVNTVLRRGFSAPEPRHGKRKRYRVEIFDSPFRNGIDPLRLNQFSDELEVDDSLERTQR